MDMDLSHIDRQIRNNELKIEDLRSQAETHRRMAGQKTATNDPQNANYYDAAALRFDQQAAELEDENNGLQDQRQTLEARITELEGELTRMDADHQDQRNALTDELERLRGSGLMV